MSHENVTVVETTPGEPLGAAFVCGPRGHGALVKRFHNTGKTSSEKKGQLERHGVKRNMLLISINGHNVTQLMFEEIILLLRACREQPKMLVFNMKMGQDAVRIDSSRKGRKPKIFKLRSMTQTGNSQDISWISTQEQVEEEKNRCCTKF